DKVGLAKVVIRTRQYVAAVIPRGDALVLETLRFGHEIRSIEEAGIPVDDLAAQAPSDSEKQLARTLVDQPSTDFRPHDYQDEYRDAVLEYVERKVEEGGTARLPTAPEVTEDRSGEVVDIMELLKRSVEARRDQEAPKEEGAKEEKKARKGKKK